MNLALKCTCKIQYIFLSTEIHFTLQTTYLLSNLSLTTPSLGLAWTFADFTFFSKFSKAFLSAFCFRNTSKMKTNEKVCKFSLLHWKKCYSNVKWIRFHQSSSQQMPFMYVCSYFNEYILSVYSSKFEKNIYNFF